MIEAKEYLDILKEQVNAGKEASMIITGNSMQPFLLHGRDCIYFSSPKKPLVRGDMVFFQRPDGKYVMHRLYKKNGSECYFLGDNQTEAEGPLDESCIFAVVTRVKRKGRIIGPRDFMWFFFQKIWINLVPLRFMIISLYRTLFQKR